MRYLKIVYAVSVLFLFDSIFSFDKILSFDTVNEARGEKRTLSSSWLDNRYPNIFCRWRDTENAAFKGVLHAQPYCSLTKYQWSGEYHDPFFTPTCHIRMIHRTQKWWIWLNRKSNNYFLALNTFLSLHYHMKLWKISNEVLEKSNNYFLSNTFFSLSHKINVKYRMKC